MYYVYHRISFKFFICYILVFTFIFFKNLSSSSQVPENKRQSKYVELIYGNPGNLYCKCGKVNNEKIEGKNGGAVRIVGGSETVPHQYPWMAYLTLNSSILLCGAVIISDRYVLTAAHCFPNLTPTFDVAGVKVVVGEHNRCKMSMHSVIFSISKYLPHPQYDSKTYQFDIMLIQVNMRITFDKFIRPICLFGRDEIRLKNQNEYIGKMVGVLGWGREMHGDKSKPVPVSCLLNRVDVPILSYQQCSESTIPEKAGPILPNSTFFCAGEFEGGKDACQGDSGSPAQILSRGKYYLIGIVSNGYGCALPRTPGLYTDIPRFLPWIYRHTSDSAYCW